MYFLLIDQLMDVKLMPEHHHEHGSHGGLEERHTSSALGTGTTIVIIIASVGGFCCICLVMLQVGMVLIHILFIISINAVVIYESLQTIRLKS